MLSWLITRIILRCTVSKASKSEKSSKLSTVNMRMQEKEEDQDLDEGNMFGQTLEWEELRT